VTNRKVRYTELKAWADQHRIDLQEHFLDRSVYRSYGKFRIIGTSKQGKRSPLQPLTFHDDLAKHFISNACDLPEFQFEKTQSNEQPASKPDSSPRLSPQNDQSKSIETSSDKPIANQLSNQSENHLSICKQSDLNTTSSVSLQYNRDDIKFFLDCLSYERIDTYQTWIEIGMALKNLDPEYLDLWVQSSQRSKKFQPGSCEVKWPTFSTQDNRLTSGSLMHWAWEDNPAQMSQWHKAFGICLLADVQDEPAKIVIKLKQPDLFAIVGQKNLADQFVFENQQDIKLTTAGQFYFWNPEFCYWKEGNHDRFFYVVASWIQCRCHAVFQTLETHILEAQPEHIEALKKELKDKNRSYARLTSKTYIDGVIKHTMTMLIDEQFHKLRDQDKDSINFKDVLFDLRTLTTRKRERQDYVTLTLEYCYRKPDPLVRQRVEQIMREILNNDNWLFESICAYLGYCLTGHTNQKAFLTLIGYEADNGKTTLCTMFMRSLPIYCKKIDNKTFAFK